MAHPNLEVLFKKKQEVFINTLRKRFKPKTIALKDPKGVLSSHIVFGPPDQVLLEHRLATCCRPIQGDQIFGFVDKDGIDVHRTDCRQAIHLQGRFAEKVLIARWATGESQQFNATLRFSGIDSAGLIMKVTSLITKDLNVDIRALHIDGNEGIFTGTISVKVSDRGQLVELAHQLKSIKGIDRVEREINKVL